MSKLQEFDPSVETWDRFIFRLRNYFRVEGIPDDAANQSKRQAILQQGMGVKLLNRYLDVVGVATAEGHTFDQTVQAVRNIVQPAPLEIAERFQFARRRQLQAESPSDYMASLRKLALTCNFAGDAATVEQKRLRDQFIFGLASEEMQRYLLQQPNLTVTNVVQLSEQFAQARSTANLFQGKVEANAIRTRPNTGQTEEEEAETPAATDRWRPCRHCGRRHDGNRCKFKDAECYRCGKTGHIQKVCRSNQTLHREVVSSKGTKGHSKVKEVAGQDDDYSSEDESNYVDQINDTSPRYCVDVGTNNGRSITLEVDTGTGQTIISKADWKKLGSPRLRYTRKMFQSYSGHKVRAIGCGRLDVWLLPVGQKGRKKVYPARYPEGKAMRYCVVDTRRASLLGRQWVDAMQINLGSCRRQRINNYGEINQVHTPLDDRGRRNQNTKGSNQNTKGSNQWTPTSGGSVHHQRQQKWLQEDSMKEGMLSNKKMTRRSKEFKALEAEASSSSGHPEHGILGKLPDREAQRGRGQFKKRGMLYSGTIMQHEH